MIFAEGIGSFLIEMDNEKVLEVLIAFTYRIPRHIELIFGPGNL